MNRIFVFLAVGAMGFLVAGLWLSHSDGNSPPITIPKKAGMNSFAAPPARPLAEVSRRGDLSAEISRLRLDSDRREFDPVIVRLAQTDRRTLEEILSEIPDLQLGDYLLNRLAIRLARQHPAETAAWLADLPDGIERASAQISVGRIWAESAPAQAATYAANFPVGRLRQQVLTAALSVWISQDIEAASRWILQAGPSPDFDAAAAEIARSPEVLEGPASAALGWAESISNEAQRRQAIGIILASWAERDRPAAIEFAQNNAALRPEQRNELMDELNFRRASRTAQGETTTR